MRIRIDNIFYNLNLTRVAEHLQAWYQTNKHSGDTIYLENGKKVDFSRKSITRLALKTALVPIAIPALKMMYKMKGAEVPPHEKHEDLIDYLILNMLGAIALFDKDNIYVESIESSERHIRLVESISTKPPSPVTKYIPAIEEKSSFSGGTALVHSGEDGYGKDETYQRDNMEENSDTT